MNTYIYILMDLRGQIRYVGKANCPRKRLSDHIKDCFSGKVSHKISWIKSLISRGERPSIEVIDEVPNEEWQFWEKYWINQLKQWGFNLTNLTEGGQGANGYKHSIEAKEIMRKAKLGNKLSKDHKKKISNSIKTKASENPLYNRGEGNSKIILDKELLYQKYIIILNEDY